MKKKNRIITLLFLLLTLSVSAQLNLGKILDNSKKKAENNIKNRIEKRIDNAVNKTLDKVEDSAEDAVKGKDEKKETPESVETTKTTKTKKAKSSDSAASTEEEPSGVQIEKADNQALLTWNKYDFVPGTELIFEEDFKGEQNGEFPSRWDITKGTVEIVKFGEDNAVCFMKTNANAPDAIMPLLDTRKTDYLPDEFTVEFDCYFYDVNNENRTYYLFLYDMKNQRSIMSASRPVRITYNRIEYNQIGNEYPGQSVLKPKAGWRHVAISFNKRALKGYLDDTRLLNIPNCEFNPTGIMLTAHNTSGTAKPLIKNIRIAKGAVPLYDKFLVNGKFITNGIKFDVNKATIKTESMGVINYVIKMMTEHPELKFSVEGHTDSDGEELFNQKLSEARAKAVVDIMVKSGISPDRLSSKGHGETKPLSLTETPEGKAQNRRVEFVKI
jgi:outer membrane protein OmpA-like peptidoglycan-associated protein